MKIQILGLGNFGTFIARHFLESGFEVGGWDTASASGRTSEKVQELEALVCRAGFLSKPDVVVLALFPDQVRAECSRLDANALLVNVSSVQQQGIDALAGIGRDRILSFHTLFGPNAVNESGWKGKQMIITMEPKDERAVKVLESFVPREVEMFRMSVAEHDSAMLPHALAFLIAELVQVGVEGADMRFLAPSAKVMLSLPAFTERGSPELRRLVLSNPALKSVIPRLTASLQKFLAEHG